MSRPNKWASELLAWPACAFIGRFDVWGRWIDTALFERNKQRGNNNKSAQQKHFLLLRFSSSLLINEVRRAVFGASPSGLFPIILSHESPTSRSTRPSPGPFILHFDRWSSHWSTLAHCFVSFRSSTIDWLIRNNILFLFLFGRSCLEWCSKWFRRNGAIAMGQIGLVVFGFVEFRRFQAILHPGACRLEVSPKRQRTRIHIACLLVHLSLNRIEMNRNESERKKEKKTNEKKKTHCTRTESHLRKLIDESVPNWNFPSNSEKTWSKKAIEVNAIASIRVDQTAIAYR